MSEFSSIYPSTWERYSTGLLKKILQPLSVGFLTKEEGYLEEMRLLIGEEGSFEAGNFVRLYLLIDTTDGVIAEAKFQAFGEAPLIGAAEILCEMVLRKTYDQAKRITADLIDTHVRDNSGLPAFPEETHGHINLVLDALDQIINKALDIPLPDEYVATPVDVGHLSVGEYPDWANFSHGERLATIKAVIESDVQPYVALDEGAVVIKELKGELEVIISYEGSCTTCYSATGSTLSAIQGVLRAKVHPAIVVTPDL